MRFGNDIGIYSVFTKWVGHAARVRNRKTHKILRNRPAASNISTWLKIQCEGTVFIKVVKGTVKDWNSVKGLISLFTARLPAVH
jgi:hypothetical protein